MTNDLRMRTKEKDNFAMQLSETNDALAEKSKILEEKIKETERINKRLVGRELRMIELKKQIEDQNNDASGRNDV